MQFIVTAYDYPNSLDKRLAVREQHIQMGDKMKAKGNYIMGVALLGESDEMIGSVMILDYPSRKELDAWLKVEPYVINNVWEKIEIKLCRVGPTFLK